MPDLKKQNQKTLTALLMMALVPLYLSMFFLYGESLFERIQSHSALTIAQLTAMGVGPIVCLKLLLLLIVNVVSADVKERIVHLRWHNPLPGSRADKLILKDHRIDVDSLSEEARALLDEEMSPRTRNAKWYKTIYRPVRDTPAVANTHRHYLLYREAGAGVFIILILMILADVLTRTLTAGSLMTAWAYASVFAYLLLLIGAANVAGNRMVTGAIANFENPQ